MNVKSAADLSSTPPRTIMTPAYVEAVGRIAYIFGWPLVNNLNRSLAMKDVPEPGRIGGVVPVAPWGHVSMLTDYIDAAERFVTCPNQDTVYGAGYQHLDRAPAIVQVPDFGPGADRESNWVPTPADEFSLYIRAYWPKPEIVEERWTPPAVTPVK